MNKNKVLKNTMIFIVFFIFPYCIIFNLSQDKLYYTYFISLFIVVASADKKVMRLGEVELLLLANLNFIIFLILIYIFNYPLKIVFLYSFILSYSSLYLIFNKWSKIKYKKEIDFVGGPGFNISRDNTPLGVLFSFLAALVGILYFTLYLYLE